MKTYHFIGKLPSNFFGNCMVTGHNNDYIAFYKNRVFHRKFGPAIIYKNGDKCWYLNGLRHREDGPAREYTNGNKYWYYKNKRYGEYVDFTNESWKEKVKELKYLESLKIFK